MAQVVKVVLKPKVTAVPLWWLRLQGGSTDEVSVVVAVVAIGGGGGTSINPRGEGGGGSGFDSTGLGVLTVGSYVSPETQMIHENGIRYGAPHQTHSRSGIVIICHPLNLGLIQPPNF